MKLVWFSMTVITLTGALIGCSSESEDVKVQTATKEKYRQERQEQLDGLVNNAALSNKRVPIIVMLNGTKVKVIPDTSLDSKVEESIADKGFKLGFNRGEISSMFLATGRGIMAEKQGSVLARDECIATSGLQALKTFKTYLNTTTSVSSNQVEKTKTTTRKSTSSMGIVTPVGVQSFSYNSSSKTDISVIQGKSIDSSSENISLRVDSGPACTYQRDGAHVTWDCDVKFIASLFNSGLRSTDNALAINAIHSELGTHQCATAFTIQFYLKD